MIEDGEIGCDWQSGKSKSVVRELKVNSATKSLLYLRLEVGCAFVASDRRCMARQVVVLREAEVGYGR